MNHTKSYIVSQETKSALEYLYREIEDLESKVLELERKIRNLEK